MLNTQIFECLQKKKGPRDCEASFTKIHFKTLNLYSIHIKPSASQYFQYFDCNTYQNVKLFFFKYAGIIHAVKTLKTKCGENNKVVKLSSPLIKSYIYNVLKCTQAKCFYEFLNKNASVTTGKAKWSELFDIDNVEWKAIHKIPFVITKHSKLHGFNTG
jgi:hypothetical protein